MAWHRFLLLLVNIIGHYPIYCVAELTGKFPLGGHDIIQMDKHNETITVAMCLENMKCNLLLGHEWPTQHPTASK